MSSELSLRFPTTRWSLVLRAADGRTGEARQALDELLRRYLRPLNAYLVRSRGMAPVEAEELLQGFIAQRVLENRLLASADSGRGRFRTLLLHALDCYVADRFRYHNRQKRRDALATAIHLVPEPADRRRDPDLVFDVEWAREVLGQALCAMQEAAGSQGRQDVWGVFEARVVRPALYGAEPTPYHQLIDSLSLASPEQASNLLVTAKRMFHRCLRQVIAAYASDEAEIDSEIVELEQLLAQAVSPS